MGAVAGRSSFNAKVAVLAVSLACVLVLSVLFLTLPVPQSSKAGSPRSGQTGNVVDPQFLPQVLAPPTAESDGAFGGSLVVTATDYVVGEPNATVYGYAEGAVQVESRTNGSVLTLAAPYSFEGFSEFGAAVAVTGNDLVVGSPGLYYNGSGTGAVYVYNLDSGALLHTYYSPISTTDEEFGASVAASGNYVVVGAPGQNGTGAAYLIDLTTEAMTLVPAPLPASDRSFGESVAISGTFFAVGDPQAYVSSEPVGTVFTFTTTTGDLLHIFQSPSTEPEQEFGNALSLQGTTLAIGAAGTTVGYNTSTGDVYVANLIYNSIPLNLSDPNPFPGGNFGSSVAVGSGGAIVVGADGETTNVNVPSQIKSGVAYVFSSTEGDLVQSEMVPTTWVQQAGPGFGASVSVLGTVVVVGDPGAYASDVKAAGLAYSFDEIPLTVSSPYPTPVNFGYSVGISDGIAVIGSPLEDTPGSNASADFEAGNAYLVSTSNLGLTLLANPDPVTGGQFGYSVAISGGSVVVGAPTNNESSGPIVPAGQAYLFNTSTGVLEHTFDSKYPTLAEKHDAPNGEFGYSVAISSSWIAIGAPFEARSSNETGPALGNVYVYYASNDSLASVVTAPGGENNSSFGASVAIAGNWILVGAPDNVNYNLNVNVSGSVYVFDAGNGTLVANISNPFTQYGAAFGTSIAAQGATVVVGAPGQNESVPEHGAGAVSVFSLASRGGPVTVRLVQTLLSPDPVPYGAFGMSVAFNGGEIAVGAPYDNGDPSIPLPQAGSVYLFSPSNGLLLDRYGNPTPGTDAEFGEAVAMGPSRVIVGVPVQYPTGVADIFCWGASP